MQACRRKHGQGADDHDERRREDPHRRQSIAERQPRAQHRPRGDRRDQRRSAAARWEHRRPDTAGGEPPPAGATSHLSQFGLHLDILVNNAGIYEFAPIENVTPEHFHKMFDLNVLGLILASQEAVKYFKPSGGSIINISSVASTQAPPTASVYSATKAAVDAVTRSLAKELGPRNIRVNSINPGMVDTEGVRAAGISDSDFRKQIEAQTPLGRIGQPQDIAPAAVFLASTDSGWMTGETIYISGGLR